MAEKYEVVKPWHGVALGDVVELGKVHPSLKPHVRKLSDKAAAELVPATPGAGTDNKARKEAVIARLDELGIEHKGNLGLEKLTELLPEGELEKLFPAE
ncbi:hypothetical protein RZR38_19120 [Citrobacter freundii]|uniref:hypothetical protein n=1 Tax=Citrobacter freundii TaxID=546 RepID=UPI00292BC7F7|nr:hypothetical protein [Citrobacter freundii]MDV1857882.1 hypothetical protein [Citrobacter freundii]MEB0419076.1 hypothetical protein [Citrobacter freundii]MEB0917895.1 hypothetical protein [Citrobacter freundii]